MIIQEHLQEINIDQLLQSMLKQINQKISGFADEDIFMVGIHSGGYWVADYLYRQLSLTNPLGSLNISFYRDDFTHLGLHPQVKPSELPVNVDNKHIILVDDVLYTGRTVRAALNEIFDYGRPASVIFCCLIDREEQELPLKADIIGSHVKLPPGKQIKLSGPEPLKLSILDTDTIHKN